ncbi:endo-glucanase RCE3 [Dichotomocladium elegans]|nr:endo-glucanase RCE3 [Dichotomocladium elegans]
MRTTVIGFLVALAGTQSLVYAAENPPYGQCGGKGWTGSTSCSAGYECKVQNDYYSQCVPSDTSNTNCSKAYGQCGGKAFTGSTCCVAGFECVKANAWYSQCLPSYRYPSSGSQNSDSKPVSSSIAPETKPSSTSVKASTTTTTTKAAPTTTTAKVPTTTTKATTKTTTTTKAASTTTTTKSGSGGSSTYAPISGGASGSGTTTRYWDCCKASCGWNGKASVSSPVGSCAADGVKLVGVDTQSGCNGGSAYMCNDNQPWAVNEKLAYGFAAASIAGSNEAGWCCGCYELTFTSGPVSGKKMVVQVTNTGGDLGSNHFDLQMPGGGVGIFNGCQNQWNAPADGWGQRYGGLSSASGCADLPKPLRAGCEWRFNWFKNADNPTMTFKEVTCPAELVAKTGCKRI